MFWALWKAWEDLGQGHSSASGQAWTHTSCVILANPSAKLSLRFLTCTTPVTSQGCKHHVRSFRISSVLTCTLFKF